MSSMEERLQALEARITRLEAQNQSKLPAVLPPKISASKPASVKPSSTSLVTHLLGWGGAGALVLAAAYLIKLALSSGWFTPERQIGITVLSAFVMIGLGLKLKRADRVYASLLPGAGVTVLFIAAYAAHLYYGLIGVSGSFLAVSLICLLSLWLCHVFQTSLYGLFSVVGAYSVPFLITGLMPDFRDLILYYFVWSLLFAAFALWVGSRSIYLAALYLSMIGFHLCWQDYISQHQWLSAVLFQTVLLIIFLATAAYFTIYRQSSLSRDAAAAHLPAILIFYFIQYSQLNEHIADYAAWIAIASAGFVALCYLLISRFYRQTPAGGKLLLQAYLALVLFHAGYIEMIPDAWAPWVALVLMPLAMLYSFKQHNLSAPGFFIWSVIGLIFFINYLRVLSGAVHQLSVAPDLLSICYALQLYYGYYLARRHEIGRQAWSLLLIAGHLAAIAAAAHLFDNRVFVSISWGALAVLCLLLALQYKDKLLGKSSLLIFAVSAGKVVVYDLSASPTLIRIGSLIAIGCSLYLGGWLYKKIELLQEV